MAPDITQFSINLPFGIGGVTLKLSEEEKKAAWALYVEFATRVATQGLDTSQGSAREALSSLYRLFEVTRETLKIAGPRVAHGPDSLGPRAIQILNDGLRPFLVEWHTRLSAFEDEQRLAQSGRFAPGVQPVIDESKWEQHEAFYNAMEKLRNDLGQYVEVLALLSGIKKK